MSDEQQLLRVRGVSPLVFADEQLFRAAFSSQSVRYANSWLYMLRAAHIGVGGMGYKYVSPELVAAIGYRAGHLYITPALDTTGGMALGELCEALYAELRCPIVLKKLDEQAFSQLPLSKVAIAGPSLPLEDEACPETVLQLQRLFTSSAANVNPVAKKLIRRARAFEKHGLALRILDDITKVPLKKIEQFLAADSEKYASYMPIVRYLFTQKADRYKYRVTIFMHQEQVRGLYVTEVLSLTDVGVYGGITSKDIGGITEWMDLYFFKQLFLDGVRTVHLGGAENEGIAEYINKLFPHRPAYATHARLFNPGTASDGPAVHIRAADETDLNDLAVLYRNLYNSLDDLGETWTKESAHRLVSHLFARQQDLFFMAEHNGKVVGAIVAAVQPWWDGNHLVEGEIFIDPQYEQAGLNKQLLRKLLRHARDKYHIVAWDTLTPVTDKHPLSTYKQIGFDDAPQWAAITGDVHTVLERLGA